VVKGVAHALVKERGLQSTPAQLWNRRRLAKQRNFFVYRQHASGARRAVNFSEEV
jgi:hypothetical protein